MLMTKERTERLKARPYRFRVVGNMETWTSIHYSSREDAIRAIRKLQAKGYRITAFQNEWTGKRLQIPQAKRR